MLVLTRKAGQQILIGKGLIQMKVLKVDDDIISIGIKAPQHIDIDREEIYLKKLQQEQAESSIQKVAP
ncbi:TPA: carbon storage regulator [Legionella pneumophila]|nr:carbon storage regulator [Legionella pneumophila]HDO7968914.1 carbon storage regulator [Legionella pneumophila]HDO7983738.1 carbon storage regulator [Legionella pneumophila]HDO8070168.1 carbon storage regulator [Legionella pneumophila]HDO8084799.1 carbon storage regulator [Legionella pneumophila]